MKYQFGFIYFIIRIILAYQSEYQCDIELGSHVDFFIYHILIFQKKKQSKSHQNMHCHQGAYVLDFYAEYIEKRSEALHSLTFNTLGM